MSLHSILTNLIPGKFKTVPMTGTRLKKLTATGKNPLKIENNMMLKFQDWVKQTYSMSMFVWTLLGYSTFRD